MAIHSQFMLTYPLKMVELIHRLLNNCMFTRGYNSWKIRPLCGGLPSGYVKIAIENGPVEIVSFPIEKCS